MPADHGPARGNPQCTAKDHVAEIVAVVVQSRRCHVRSDGKRCRRVSGRKGAALAGWPIATYGHLDRLGQRLRHDDRAQEIEAEMRDLVGLVVALDRRQHVSTNQYKAIAAPACVYTAPMYLPGTNARFTALEPIRRAFKSSSAGCEMAAAAPPAASLAARRGRSTAPLWRRLSGLPPMPASPPAAGSGARRVVTARTRSRRWRSGSTGRPSPRRDLYQRDAGMQEQATHSYREYRVPGAACERQSRQDLG